MDVGNLAGYRWVLAGHYDTHFDAQTPDDAARAHEACRAYLARVLDALRLPDEGRHLDLGCGSGLAALAVARARPSLRVVGVDLSANALALARVTAAAEGLADATFLEADAETPPAGPFERATALSILNLMPDKEAALAAWRRAVAPRGRLALADAFRVSGPGTTGAGALGDAAFAALLGRTGWRAVHREDLTPLVRRLHEAKAWPWPEYVRPGFGYLLHALEAR